MGKNAKQEAVIAEMATYMQPGFLRYSAGSKFTPFETVQFFTSSL